MKICIGGTFNILHSGHKLLIDKAFQIAGKQGSVFIGITTGKILKNKTSVESFEQRKESIEKYLREKRYIERAIIQPITDEYGPSVKREYDAIIVSPETVKTAEEINKKRRQNGKKTLEIIKIPFVLAEDGLPISSSRIKNHEIDRNGRVLKRD